MNLPVPQARIFAQDLRKRCALLLQGALQLHCSRTLLGKVQLQLGVGNTQLCTLLLHLSLEALGFVLDVSLRALHVQQVTGQYEHTALQGSSALPHPVQLLNQHLAAELQPLHKCAAASEQLLLHELLQMSKGQSLGVGTILQAQVARCCVITIYGRLQNKLHCSLALLSASITGSLPAGPAKHSSTDARFAVPSAHSLSTEQQSSAAVCLTDNTAGLLSITRV